MVACWLLFEIRILLNFPVDNFLIRQRDILTRLLVNQANTIIVCCANYLLIITNFLERKGQLKINGLYHLHIETIPNINIIIRRNSQDKYR